MRLGARTIARVGDTTRRSLFLAALCGCAWLSLRPDARLEGWLDVALTPTRALSELCAPWRWLRLRRVGAAEEQFAQRADREYVQRRALYEAQRLAALPTNPELSFARRFVHAEVVGRRSAHFDLLVVRLDSDSCAGLARGMPVCAGDVFVGRLAELGVEQQPGLAWVELVTSSRFAVGARVPSDGARAEVRCVVGGLAEVSRADLGLFLAVSSPSAPVWPVGAARVDESLSPLARFAVESNGFLLGSPQPSGDGEWVLQPLVDYSSGLYELVIAAPADIDRPPDRPNEDELSDGRWRLARATSVGEPSAARDGFELGLGRWGGALDGAALVSGARLVGRIAHAGTTSSDARRIGDPGFSVHVLARVEGRAAPVVLGRMIALRRRAGGIEFLWPAPLGIAPLAGETHVRATLFTGSGDELVPRGLLLGEALLPTRPGPHVVLLEPGVDASSLGRVWVRSAPTEGRP